MLARIIKAIKIGLAILELLKEQGILKEQQSAEQIVALMRETATTPKTLQQIAKE